MDNAPHRPPPGERLRAPGFGRLVPPDALMPLCVVVALWVLLPAAALPVLFVVLLKTAGAVALGATAAKRLAALAMDHGTGPVFDPRSLRRTRVATVGLCGLAVTLPVVGLGSGRDLTPEHVMAVVLLVAVVPVEVPGAAAVVLASAAGRMERRGVRLRDLATVGRVGATEVVCVRRERLFDDHETAALVVVAGGRSYRAEREGYVREGGDTAAEAGVNAALDACLLAGVACDDGSPADHALLASAARLGIRHAAPRAATLPPAPDRRYMATLHPNGAAPATVFVKGEVERVLYLCRDRLDADGERGRLDRADVLATARALRRRGLRVVAFAETRRPAGTTELPEQDLFPAVFLGLQALHTPPLPAMAATIRACADAGVEVKMVTRDEGTTASTTAFWIGLDGSSAVADAAADPAADAVLFAHAGPAEERAVIAALARRRPTVALLRGARSARAPAEIVGDESGDGALHVRGDLVRLAFAIGTGRRALAALVRILRWALAAALAGVAAAVALDLAAESSTGPLWWFPALAVLVVLAAATVRGRRSSARGDGRRRAR